MIDGVPNSRVAAALGWQRAHDLSDDGADRLVTTREEPLATFTARQGWTSDVGDAVARLVRHHAARTLFDTDPEAFPTSAVQAILDNA